MEGYRSYPEGQPGYQEGQPAYQEGGPAYQEGGQPQQGWYGDWNQRDGESYEEPRHDPGRDPVREAARPSPAPAAAAEPIRMVPRPGPLPQEEPRVPRRPPVAPGSPGAMSDGVYRSKRPAAALLFGVPAAILELPVLFLLLDAAFADPASPPGVIAAACAALALPLLAVGLYAVATGAVRAAGPNSAQAWLRPPVAYLSVALVLFIAAGLAAG